MPSESEMQCEKFQEISLIISCKIKTVKFNMDETFVYLIINFDLIHRNLNKKSKYQKIAWLQLKQPMLICLP